MLILQRLVVCLEESLYIHNIRDMKVLHTIRDTPPNPNGLCALSINNDNCFLAYPGSNQIGEVQIFDCVNLVSTSKFICLISFICLDNKFRYLFHKIIILKQKMLAVYRFMKQVRYSSSFYNFLQLLKV